MNGLSYTLVIINFLLVAFGQHSIGTVEVITPLEDFPPFPPVQIIPNQYIFKFQNNVSHSLIAKYYENLEATLEGDEELLFKYSIGSFRGFAAKLQSSNFEIHRQYSELFEYIEKDSTMYFADAQPMDYQHVRNTKPNHQRACSTQEQANWGLCRIASEELTESLNTYYTYPSSSGQSVTAYIIDTGIDIEHEDFSGRAIWGANFIKDSPDTDCAGHGTHVAGIVGSDTYGVAKKVTLIALKVFPCHGGGPISAGVAAVQWATNHFINNGKKASVVNMSMGARLGSFDAVVKESIAAGLPYVIASGNSANDACKGSPAVVAEAVKVSSGSIESLNGFLEDIRSSYSNFGTCVTLFAPGELIESTYIGDGNTETKTMSGTSMASPMVAGVVALYLGENGYSTPAEVKNYLLANAKSNEMDLLCTNSPYKDTCLKTPNKLVSVSCE